uniref:C2 domain-containing protein n=1 Tax=Romanomermis culicivorax TaxID=13658 RepID=A0A915KK01_ROMCU
MMVIFTGAVKIRVIEAADLKPTEWSTRLSSTSSKNVSTQQQAFLDSYVNIDVDEYLINKTLTIQKSSTPKWDEEFCTDVQNGHSIGFTVFHDSAIPPDDFVANARISFDDLDKDSNDFWIRELCENIIESLHYP